MQLNQLHPDMQNIDVSVSGYLDDIGTAVTQEVLLQASI